MSSNAISYLNTAAQKIVSARNALRYTTVNLYTNSEGQNGRLISLEIDGGHFQEGNFNSSSTAGILDSHDQYQREQTYSTTHVMNEGSINPFDRNNWSQTGVQYEETENGETTFSVERISEAAEPDQSWLDDHLSANAHIAGGDIDALSHEGSVAGLSFENEHHQLEADVLGYETGGSATIGVGRDGVNIELSANAEAYLLNAEYEGRYGPGYGQAEVFVGGEASANLEANFNPLQGNANVDVGGEAFLGGKAEGELGVDGQYGNANVNAGVSYGVGAEAGADVGIQDGRITAEVDLGLTVGLGFDVGFEVEIDAKETAKDLTGWIPGTPW